MTHSSSPANVISKPITPISISLRELTPNPQSSSNGSDLYLNPKSGAKNYSAPLKTPLKCNLQQATRLEPDAMFLMRLRKCVASLPPLGWLQKVSKGAMWFFSFGTGRAFTLTLSSVGWLTLFLSLSLSLCCRAQWRSEKTSSSRRPEHA